MYITKDRKEAFAVLEECKDSMDGAQIVESPDRCTFAVCSRSEKAAALLEMQAVTE